MKTLIYAVVFSLFLSATVRAALVGEVSVGGIKWSNAYEQNDIVTPHVWINYMPESLIAWQPSIPSSIEKVTLIRRGGTESTELTINVWAVEYNMNAEGVEDTPFFPGSATRSKRVFSLRNFDKESVFYTKTLNYTNVRSPFTAFKPSFKIGGLNEAFDDKPNGIYEGAVQLTLPVVYKRTPHEQVTYRRETFIVPVQIINKATTCQLSMVPGAYTVDLGVMVINTENEREETKVVPIKLTCNQKLFYGDIVLRGEKAPKTIFNNILKTSTDGVGIELEFTNKNMGDVEFNRALSFVKLLGGGIRAYDLSLNATPIFIDTSENVSRGPYDAIVNIKIIYD